MGGGYLLIILILLVVTNGITYGVTSIQSESVSYTKKDGNLTTVKSALDELITKSSKVDELQEKVTDYEKKVHYLADKVTVGDYVAYDAGTWSENKDRPTSQGQFGGYNSGQSKNASVEWCYQSIYKTTLKGWRVLKVAGNQVYLVHAGQPECYYHASGGYSDASVKALNDRAKSYMDGIYADSAHAMTEEEAQAITGNTNATEDDLRTTGDFYWLATKCNSNTLWLVYFTGLMYGSDGRDYSWGFRPVIVLKSDVLTTGQDKDMFGNKAWILA